MVGFFFLLFKTVAAVDKLAHVVTKLNNKMANSTTCLPYRLISMNLNPDWDDLESGQSPKDPGEFKRLGGLDQVS